MLNACWFLSGSVDNMTHFGPVCLADRLVGLFIFPVLCAVSFYSMYSMISIKASGFGINLSCVLNGQ